MNLTNIVTDAIDREGLSLVLRQVAIGISNYYTKDAMDGEYRYAGKRLEETNRQLKVLMEPVVLEILKLSNGTKKI